MLVLFYSDAVSIMSLMKIPPSQIGKSYEAYLKPIRKLIIGFLKKIQRLLGDYLKTIQTNSETIQGLWENIQILFRQIQILFRNYWEIIQTNSETIQEEITYYFLKNQNIGNQFLLTIFLHNVAHVEDVDMPDDAHIESWRPAMGAARIGPKAQRKREDGREERR